MQLHTPLTPMKVIFIYFLCVSFVFSWWFLAFSDYFSPSKPLTILQNTKPIQNLSNPAFNIDRSKLQQALRGDKNLMCALIAEWDIEAEMLQTNGIPAIQRMKPNDLKNIFSLWQSKEKTLERSFYPQTYLAAGILLALVPESRLLALPKGFRHQTTLFPKEQTDLIPFDADPYHLEAISSGDNMIAFISPYSHPSTILALEQRSISTINLRAVLKPDDLKNAIELVGQTVGANNKSKILNYFIDAALMAMNNHISSLKAYSNQNILYLNYRTFFSAPNLTTLTGYMLKQLNINQCLEMEGNEGWEIPLEIEDILQIDPDCLIFSTSDKQQLTHQLKRQPALSELKAFKDNRVYFVDKNIQETPWQHFLLGYFDLYEILIEVSQ